LANFEEIVAFIGITYESRHMVNMWNQAKFSFQCGERNTCDRDWVIQWLQGFWKL